MRRRDDRTPRRVAGEHGFLFWPPAACTSTINCNNFSFLHLNESVSVFVSFVFQIPPRSPYKPHDNACILAGDGDFRTACVCCACAYVV